MMLDLATLLIVCVILSSDGHSVCITSWASWLKLKIYLWVFMQHSDNQST